MVVMEIMLYQMLSHAVKSGRAGPSK